MGSTEQWLEGVLLHIPDLMYTHTQGNQGPESTMAQVTSVPAYSVTDMEHLEGKEIGLHVFSEFQKTRKSSLKWACFFFPPFFLVPNVSFHPIHVVVFSVIFMPEAEGGQACDEPV